MDLCGAPAGPIRAFWGVLGGILATLNILDRSRTDFGKVIFWPWGASEGVFCPYTRLWVTILIVYRPLQWINCDKSPLTHAYTLGTGLRGAKTLIWNGNLGITGTHDATRPKNPKITRFLHLGLKMPYFWGVRAAASGRELKGKVGGGVVYPPKPVFGVSRRGKKIRSMGDSISTKLLRMSFFFHYISRFRPTFKIYVKC